MRKVVRFGVPAAIGKLFSSLAGLVTMALLAHQLGPALFGVIAVIRTVVAMVDQYANFNTWQAIVKYGTEALASRRHKDVERVIKLAVLIDVATAIVATLVVVGLAYVIPSAFDWTSSEAQLCALYSVTLVTKVAGAPDGIYRICDAYRAQAISTSVGGAFVTAMIAIAVALDASFEGCMYALIIGEVVNNLVFALTSFWVAGKSGYGGWVRASLRGARTSFPGVVHFLLATNAQLTVKKTNGEIDMMIVGALLGKVSAGLFRIVKQLGSIPARIFLPFEQVVFTELARCAATQDFAGFRRLLRRFTTLITLGSLAIWAVAALVAEPLLALVAGSDFVAAAPAFRWYLLGMVLVIANAPVLRALVALGRPGTLFLAELATFFVLLVALLLGARYGGLVGVSLAVVLHRTVQMIWSTLLVERTLRERSRAAQVVSAST